MPDITTADHRKAVNVFLDLLATYREAEDLINIGAYVKGNNPKIDRSLTMINAIRDFLRQNVNEKVNFEESIQRLVAMVQT